MYAGRKWHNKPSSYISSSMYPSALSHRASTLFSSSFIASEQEFNVFSTSPFCKESNVDLKSRNRGCLPFTQRFQYFRMENKWNTHFWSTQLENCRNEPFALIKGCPLESFQTVYFVPFRLFWGCSTSSSSLLGANRTTITTSQSKVMEGILKFVFKNFLFSLNLWEVSSSKFRTKYLPIHITVNTKSQEIKRTMRWQWHICVLDFNT